MDSIIPGIPGQKAYIARFHSGPIEMAYQHGPSDPLYTQLNTPNWCAGAPSAPYVNGSGASGPLYGRDTIPVQRRMFCQPFVDTCRNQNTRAPAPSLVTTTPIQPPNSLCGNK